MEKILIKKDTYIYINDEIQTGSLGRPFRLSGMQLLPMQWVGGVQKCEAIVIYRYLDNKNEFFGIKIGANNEFKEKIDNY